MHCKLNLSIILQHISKTILILLLSAYLIVPLKVNANEASRNLPLKQNKKIDVLKILQKVKHEKSLYQQLLENYHQGKYRVSLPLAEELLSIYKTNGAQLGISQTVMAIRYNDIAALYYTLGYFGKAEPLYQKALLIREKDKGLDTQDTAQLLNNLAALYYVQNDYEQAKSFFERALNLKKKEKDINHLSIATSFNNLAKVYESLKDFEKARGYFNKALDIRENKLGKEAPLTIQSINNLAMLYHSLEEYEQAKNLLEHALKTRQKVLGDQHPDTAESFNNLATLYKTLKHHKKAQLFYSKALHIWKQSLGENHPNTQLVLTNLAENHLAQGHWLKAYNLTHRLVVHYENSLDPIKQITQKNDLVSARKQLNQSYQMRLHIKASERLNSQINKPKDVIERALVAIQMAHNPHNTQSMVITALKLASEEGVRKNQVNSLIDALYKRDRASNVYSNSLILPNLTTSTNQIQLKQAIKNADVNVRQILDTLKQDWPVFNAIINPSPITVKEVKALLLPHEAILAYLTSDDESYLIVIRKNAPPILHKLNVSQEALQREISELRAGIKAYKSKNNAGKTIHIVQDYDMELANDLYNQLIKPIRPKLKGITHLITVPDIALNNLPFAALVTRKHQGNHKAYDQAHWLIKDYSLSQLPSLVSLRLVREHSKGVLAKEPFLGFGDPALKDINASLGEKKINWPFQFPFLNKNNRILSKTRALKELDSLHFAGTELKTLATRLKVDEKSRVYLREKATETQLKELNEKGILKNQKVLAFATHALLAEASSHYKGIQPEAESGLVFTPPESPTQIDDGYLTATEASQLNLNANWILLSACNTGYIVNKQDNKEKTFKSSPSGLSVLAKSFFYAGSRNLLVTQWEANDATSSQLVPELFDDTRSDENTSNSTRLQNAMIKLIEKGLEVNDHCIKDHSTLRLFQSIQCKIKSMLFAKQPNEWAHPIYWAPYVILGSGI